MRSSTPDGVTPSSRDEQPDSDTHLFSRLSAWQTLQTQMIQGPSYEIEESWLLRIMVQLLVSVGIIATDIAASDVTNALQVSYWAVPVSAVGATWSWYRRRNRNVPVKFCIALAMIFALGSFLARILAEQNDTRLALAELLIQLQVFHSFDLPRRKDLGYSMVIGLILLGVAATVSQTLAFAPLLLLFVAIALPTIALDYRSRLGVLFKPQQKASQTIKPFNQTLKRTLPLLGITLILGLAIFAVMPRFQGYQLRVFPVSEQIEVDGEFDGRTITNPGYVSGGRDLDGDGVGDGLSGDGQTFESGPGEINTESYYGFNSTMNQNLRGELTPRVVMRVRSQAEGFWRVLAFDQYTGQGWTISRQDEEDIEILERPSWSLQFRLPRTPTLARTREVIQTYTVTADLPNLIPALYEAAQLYFPTQEVAIDPDGSLRSPVNLVDGLTYTVVSRVPYRDRTRLQAATTNYTQEIQAHYLQLPEAIATKIRETTTEILDQAPNPLTNAYEKALYLGQYLKQNYTVQTELPFLADDEDLVESFLFKTSGGYPDHFSTVLTVMLRSVGIPARLVTGFAPGEFNPFTGFYIVRNTDAYALTDVYIP
ncbi:MAG: transglutaminase family protein, partial [Cyanothece sp. SIO2G6]|nr:transglutaminase family protein [Cyanothece sp. SIO2G6]